MSTWRDKARPVITQAIADGRALGLDGPALNRFISGRYPFGKHECHPYKIWLDEVRAQLKEEARRAAWDKAIKESQAISMETATS